jgi:outer membrane receptor protein involved in Fe transport
VRGGTAAIFASNAPGGLVNVISKTGGEELAGAIRLTGGDYKLFRTDFNVGGPIFGEDWRFNIGGFYRSDNGVRDPQFPANRGGQIKANLTRLFDNGYIRVNAKYLDERNIFYLPVPLRNTSEDTLDVKIEALPGFDANYGTMTSLDAASVKIPTPDDEVRDLNLKEGMHPTIRSFGGELFFTFGDGWSIKNTFRSMTSDVQFNAIFSLSNPVPANLFGQDLADRLGGASFRYSYTNSTTPFDPANANGNGLVAETGWWSVTKPLTNFANDLRFSKDWANNFLTFGGYYSTYSANEFWHFASILNEVRDAPRRLDVEILDAAGNTITATQNGFTNYANFYRNARNTANVWAAYAYDEWRVSDRFRVDVGGRVEYAEFKGNVEVLEEGIDLGDATTFADDNMTWGSSQFRPYNHDFSDWALSAGLNFELISGLNLYGRGTRGFRMPDFEEWAGGNVDSAGASAEIYQGEAGLKWASNRLGIFGAFFFSDFDRIQFSDEVVVGGNLVTVNRFAGSRTYGIEAEVVWLPTTGLRLDAIATAQNPEYRNYSFSEGGEEKSFDGNRVRRLPRYLGSLKLAYTFQVRGAPALWSDVWYIDERFTDDANTPGAKLPSYIKLNAGGRWDIAPQVGIWLQVFNITNAIGLTEGNPRVGQVVGAPAENIMARPILGRHLRAALEYRF